MNTASFEQLGAAMPASPVILSVPHAGRDYPAVLRAALRVPASALLPLEDRHVDAVARAARHDETMLIQTMPRAWIDLNRGEDERDPKVDEGATQRTQPLPSPKLRSGLGLVPRRAGSAGDLWSRRFGDAEILARITCDHRPYHSALGSALEAARVRFGVAVLLDIHSMPSLGAGAARVVLGDRFGRAAAARFVARAEAEVGASGLCCSINTPYAGGHILERHARPADGVHGIQLEIDRTLYLDPALDRPGGGLGDTAEMLRRVIAALADEASTTITMLAAE